MWPVFRRSSEATASRGGSQCVAWRRREIERERERDSMKRVGQERGGRGSETAEEGGERLEREKGLDGWGGSRGGRGGRRRTENVCRGVVVAYTVV